MTLRIGRRGTWKVETFADASRIYETERDRSGEGASTFPEGWVIDGGTRYRVSYNGRIWTKEPWRDGRRPTLVYDNR